MAAVSGSRNPKRYTLNPIRGFELAGSGLRISVCKEGSRCQHPTAVSDSLGVRQKLSRV